MRSPILKDSLIWLREDVLIGGAWVGAKHVDRIAVTNPATGRVIGTIPNLGRKDAEDAIGAAADALPGWRTTPAAERAEVLVKWQQLLLANREDLALLLTSEQGKPLAEARIEIDYAASFFGWFAGEAVRIAGRDILAPDRRILVVKQPIGVCAAITPWNFPAAMVTRKLGPALAAGCTIVLKPSELTPFTALAIARLGEMAGVPAGVLNVLTGDPEPLGAAIMESPIVRKLSFTGSTAVGRKLIEASAITVKRLSLELGGNAPFVVFDDADLDLAIEGAIASKFRNAGQTCVCANRFLVQAGIHDAFVERLGAEVANLPIGDGTDPLVKIGPLIDTGAVAKVQSHIDDALAQGARALNAPIARKDGAFIPPIVITGGTPAMRFAREETFGPMAAIIRFSTESEAINMANASDAGLAAYFYTNDARRSWRFSDALDYGMVGLNTGSISMTAAPFGGIKSSGYGREGGIEGVQEYLETKAFHWLA